MPSEELSALCAGLQRFLRLSDWRVDIDFAKPRELKSGTYAMVWWDCYGRTAKVRVRSDDAVRRAHMKPAPYGWSVAHELIHVVLEGHAEHNPELHTPPYEAGVDHLAEITWNAYSK